jgi:aryl-alcohol dehydrogenase-like predicted oxidoreductase
MKLRYKIFGQTGLRVSSVALGTGNFGKGWGYGSEREEAAKVYATYREAGGNFVDTADHYQFGQSEEMLGDFIASERDDVVLATKFSLGDSSESGLQRTGNSRKAMIQSVEASLRRLKTDRIDLLWVHMPDAVTPIDEIARGLDNLVRAGRFCIQDCRIFRRGEWPWRRLWPKRAVWRPSRPCNWNTAWSSGQLNANSFPWPRPLTSERSSGLHLAAVF